MVPQIGWTVLAAQTYDEAFHQLMSTLWIVAAGVVMAVALAVGAGRLLAGHFSDSLGRYIMQARAIADGDYQQPWPESKVLEFAELAENLRRMSRAILEREQELAASEARYRSVAINAPLVILQFDAQGLITLCEGKDPASIGLARSESIGQSIFDVYRDHPEVCGHARRAISGEPLQFIMLFGAHTFDVHFSPIQEGDAQLHVLGVALNITA